MSFQVGIGSLGGTVFFQMDFVPLCKLCLSLVFDLYILLYKPHCFACLRLQTLTLAPVSAITFTRELLIITSILKSPLHWFVLFDVVILKRLMLHISSVFCWLFVSGCSTFLMPLFLQNFVKCPVIWQLQHLELHARHELLCLIIEPSTLLLQL